ncbi:MAG: hypothetical protein POG74_09750 [Acidocella sp.]|nr:hypothetical protein [Acidocella sp.]
MNEIPLILGPLLVPGYVVKKSGIYWLYPDNYLCRKNQVVGFCNISLEAFPDAKGDTSPFAGEAELQVAFASPVAGHLRIDHETSFGGYLNFIGAQIWDARTPIAYLTPAGATGDRPLKNPMELNLLMLAGKLMTGLANYGTSLLPGWHSYMRAWWKGSASPPKTLLTLGICDAQGPVLGDHAAFLEFFEEADFACHLVIVPNELLVPCAPYLIEQFFRTEQDFNLIADDIRQNILHGPVTTTPEDYFFAGCLLTALQDSPVRRTFDIIAKDGYQKSLQPSYILLSSNAEPLQILRHKKLRYHIRIYPFRIEQAGAPACRAWLNQAFEIVPRTIADIKADYIRLLNAFRSHTNARLIILNQMSTSGREDLAFYMPFDAPMGNTLVHVAAKEMNLMLEELQTENDISVIDADAMAAEMGAAHHLPDGVHQSGLMQAQVRAEILRLMR